MKNRALKGRTMALSALAAATMCAFAFIPQALPAKANSGPGYYFGVGGAGAYPVEDCLIEVESELLTFNITGYPDSQNLSGYNSTVTARYTFFNPTDEDLTVGMLFPFGGMPEYAPWNEVYDDTALFAVTTGENDTPAEYSYRISYDEWGNYYIGNDFNFDEARQNLLSQPVEDSILSYECPVTVYEGQEVEGEVLVAKFTPNDDFYSFYDSRSYGYDGLQLWVELEEGESLYFAGNVPGDLQFYSRAYVAVEGRPYAEAVDTPISSPAPAETTTFLQFIRQIKPGILDGVSDSDWFNYLAYYLPERSYFGCEGVDSIRNLSYMMRWLEYEVTIPAGGTLVNSVTVPLYPDIGIDSEPYTYDYYYYLSPAAGWADFGTLTVRINSGDYLLDCSLDGFEGWDGVHEATFNGLPSGELYFTLCTSDNPTYIGSGWVYVVIVLLLLIPIPLLCIIVGLIVTIVLVRRDRKKFLNSRNHV